MDYPKRLIEVDLPIKRISAHALRAKSSHHGHISTLHIWWARRPLPACRAIILAALWPDPADKRCPPQFLEKARWALLEARGTSVNVPSGQITFDHAFTNAEDVRAGLLDFIAEFANSDNSTNSDYLKFARHLVQVAHEALGGQPDTRPLVVDPFAGGGSIPLEALRVGADAFASDLNPIAVLLNKVILEYIPKYARRLADEVSKWGAWVKETAEKELAEFFPKDPDGAIPIAYLWARTVRCEGHECGSVIPLIRNMQLNKSGRVCHYRITEEQNGLLAVSVVKGLALNSKGTVSGGKALCPRPSCGYATPAKNVRKQLEMANGGANNARLIAVLLQDSSGRRFRDAQPRDYEAINRAAKKIDPSGVPHDEINPIRPHRDTRGLSAVTRIGIKRFEHLYSHRQTLVLQRFFHIIQSIPLHGDDQELRLATATLLHCAACRFVFQNCSLSRYNNDRGSIEGAFGKQALQNTWDFAECNPVSNGPASWHGSIEWISKLIQANAALPHKGAAQLSPAQEQLLPDESASCLFTDPPYFAAIPYADLSDVFFVWERQFYEMYYPQYYKSGLTDKAREIIVTKANVDSNGREKDAKFYQQEMTHALRSARSATNPGGIGVVVFADTRTDSWEAILSSVIDAGWCITGSWPLETERRSRTQAAQAASLQSSIHIVCRPREHADSSARTDDVGEWRDVLQELPRRIHEWLPRLADEGIVGADAIFACLGPALEIFSRYSRVERADGTLVTLREYLEEVWAAVAKGALSLLFEGADAGGLEPDARLTAMWLWTVRTDRASANPNGSDDGDSEDNTAGDEDEDAPVRPSKSAGYSLEFDAARKIAQGLGVDLDTLKSVVEVKGKTARLLPASEREAFLFARQRSAMSGGESKPAALTTLTPKRGKSKRPARGQQSFAVDEEGRLSLLPTSARSDRLDNRPELESATNWKIAATVLDRVHQAMLLFGKGRSDALKRFLVDDGIGNEGRFWKLAQSLLALYPPGTDEKRWVAGLLARKKGLGF
ncbi:MAG: DUF1156 domain-containing protein [Patescibacteria group bacterium]|nr:DUF1156 domain-containing protein [Patescibacteria group bacterium]